MTGLKPLNAIALGALDAGRSGELINSAIQAMTEDLDRRGSDEKPRIVNIKLLLTKANEGQVECTVEVTTKMPIWETQPTVANLRNKIGTRQNELLFSEFSTDNPDQRHIGELEDDRDSDRDDMSDAG